MIAEILAWVWTTLVAASYFISNKNLYIYSLNKYFEIPGVLFFTGLIFLLVLGAVFLLTKKINNLRAWHFVALFLILTPLIGTIRFGADTFAIYRGESLEADGKMYIQTGDPVINPEQSRPLAWETYRENFETKSLPSAFLNISLKIFSALAISLIAALIIFSLGFWLAKLLGASGLLVKFGLGSVLLSLLLFLLAKTSFLNETALYIFSGLSLSFSWPAIKELASAANIKVKLQGPSVAILAAILTFLILNMIEVVEPLPGGYDDYSFYLNLPKLLAEHGSYVHSPYPYAFTLIQSFILILSKNLAAVKTFSFLFTALSLAAIFSFFKKFPQKMGGATLALIFISIPTIFIHSYLQLKVELPLFFFSILSISCFYEFIKNKSWKHLFLAGIFTGFAFSIKITAALLAASLIFMLFFRFKVKYLLVLMLGLAIPVLPWAASNLAMNKDLSLAGITLNNNANTPDLHFDELGLNDKTCPLNGATDADYARYSGDYENAVLKYLLLPWDATMSVSAKGFVTNIGFLLLALCPLSIFAFRKKDRLTKIFLAGGLFYWLLWIALGKGVIWYGISGFAYLLIMIALGSELLKNKKILSAIIIVFVSASLFLRTNIFIQRTQVLMPYLSGLANETEYINYQRPNILYMASILNADPNSTIYMSNNAVLKFFVNSNDTRIFFDPYLDSFACLYTKGDDEFVLNALKSAGLDFFILNKAADFSAEYVKEIENKSFDFANKNLQLVINDDSTFIYKIQ